MSSMDLRPEDIVSSRAAVLGCRAAGEALGSTWLRPVSDRRVGRFGVDLDWKPAGSGRGEGFIAFSPLL